MAKLVLKGITWGHSRGITPLLAAAQRYGELHPGVEIEWKKRSLQEFADSPLEKLTGEYDLLIIDHPWVGRAAAMNCVLPLNDYLPQDYLDEQARHSVGASHESYCYQEQQWALAIDAATPAASYRKDLLAKPPGTWEELLALARQGKVAVPAIPIDLLMNFYSFCIANGAEPFLSTDELVDPEVGLQAIRMMKQLYGAVDPKMFQCNPIAVAELMSRTNDYYYCPFAYCYSNYSREGFAGHVLDYTNVISVNGERLRTTIGGTGISVSASSRNKDIAVDFAAWVCSPSFQRTMYVQHGGQPGHKLAWTDETSNCITNGFFNKLLPVMENGYLRPRYNGYLHFQDYAGEPLQHCLMFDRDPETALNQMSRIYQQSLTLHRSTVTS